MSVDEVLDAIDSISADERVVLLHGILEEMEKEARPCLAETSDEFVTVDGFRPDNDSGRQSS